MTQNLLPGLFLGLNGESVELERLDLNINFKDWGKCQASMTS